MSSSKMSVDSLLNPTRGHCKGSSCVCSSYNDSRIEDFHSKYKSFGSDAPSNNRVEYADGVRVAGKCLLWPIVRTDSTTVRTHRSTRLRRKEPYSCPVNSCRLKFHKSHRLSTSIEADRKSYPCPVTTCSRRFSNSGWLSRHFHKLHAQVPEEYGMCFHIKPGPPF
jgi:hypothetical protein